MKKGTQENRVIIRVWKSNLKEIAAGKVSVKDRQVGHISIETPNRYMSLWPKDINSSNANPFYGTHKGSFIGKPETDILYETNNSPYASKADLPKALNLPTVICLYSLDVVKMEKEFDKIKGDPKFEGWCLVGNNILINRGNAHSCSSLAYTLLLAGDVYSLISSSYSASFSSITTPGMLASASALAKKVELSKYPDTQKFDLFKKNGNIKITFDIASKSKNSYEFEKTYKYEEKEVLLSTQNSYINYTTVTTAAVFGLFAVGAYYLYPEKAAEQLESLKSYLPF